MQDVPIKPYLIRAWYEWCTDNGYTPHIIVNVDADTRVPRAHVRDGQITLNVSALATQNLMIDNEHITFQARFGGVLEHVFVPVAAVLAIYARETKAGMGFEPTQPTPVPTPVDSGLRSDDPAPPGPPGRPKLTIVK